MTTTTKVPVLKGKTESFLSIAGWGTAAFLRISESCPLRPWWGTPYSHLHSPDCCATHRMLQWLSSLQRSRVIAIYPPSPGGTHILSLPSCWGSSSVVPFCNPTLQQTALARDAGSFVITEGSSYSIALHTGQILLPRPTATYLKRKKKRITWKSYPRNFFQPIQQ